MAEFNHFVYKGSWLINSLQRYLFNYYSNHSYWKL